MTPTSKLQFVVNSQNMVLNSSFGSATLNVSDLIKQHGSSGVCGGEEGGGGGMFVRGESVSEWVGGLVGVYHVTFTLLCLWGVVATYMYSPANF